MSTSQETICARSLAAAYVDGELDTDLTLLFEDHLESCASCRAELRAHRLFVCELDAALNESNEMPVPADFSRTIALRATSDMRGVRTGSENRKALSICMVLALLGFALAGAAARDALFLLAGRFMAKIFALTSLVANAAYDAGAGLAVISRVLSRRVIVETGSLGPMLLLLAIGILILSRLISNYHRTGATE